MFSIEHLDKVSTGMTDEEYFAEPRISASVLRIASRSVGHALASLIPSDPTPEQRLGTIFHKALLEPEVFGSQYVRGVEGDGRRKEIKEKRAILAERYGSENIIQPKDFDRIMGMLSACLATPALGRIVHPSNIRTLDGVRVEVPIMHELKGVPMRSKLDVVVGDEEKRVKVIDVKTTTNADPDVFVAHAAKLGYHVQAAVYMHALRYVGLEPTDYYFLAVETKPPFGVSVIRLGEQSLWAGHMDAERAIDRILPEIDHFIDAIRGKLSPEQIEQIATSLAKYNDDVVEREIPRWALEPTFGEMDS